MKTFANLGGILSTIAAGSPTTLYGRMLSGAYRIPNIHSRCSASTRTPAWSTPTGAPGRPEATYAVERTIDLLARELELDPVEVRRKNFVPPDAFPYDPRASSPGWSTTPAITTRRSTRALEMAGYEDFRSEQEAARAEGRYLGIGLSSYVEICGVAPSAWIGTGGQGWGAGLWESANVRVHLTGKVVVTTGSHSHGQGHETTMAQVGGVGARRAGRGRDRRVRRHPRHAVRIRHLREP